MKFISLYMLAEKLDVSTDISRKEAITSLQKGAHVYFESHRSITVDGVELTEEELALFLMAHEAPEKKVFNGWVFQDPILYEYIVRGDRPLKGKEVRFYKHEGHYLEQAYKTYLTPYLLATINRGIRKWSLEQPLQDLIVHVSAIQLVDADKQGLLYGDLLQTVPVSVERDAERQWFEDQLKNGELIRFFNALSNEVYSAKIKMVERAKTMISSENNLLQKRKMLQHLLCLHLNVEHKEQLEQWAVNLDSTPSKSGRLNGKNPLLYSVGLLLLLVVGLFIWYPTTSDNVEKFNGGNNNKSTSGLDSLDKQAIHAADSLLGYQSDTTEILEYEGIPVYNPVKNTMVRTDLSIENALVKRLRESMMNDYEIRSSFSSDCEGMEKAVLHSFQFDSVRPSKALKGEAHEIKNFSSKDLFILQYEPTQGGGVWGAFFPSGVERSINLKVGHHLLVYSGKNLARFNPLKFTNQGYGNVTDARKITPAFTAHFCDFDLLDVQMLNRIYEVKKIVDSTSFESGAYRSVEVRSAAIQELP